LVLQKMLRGYTEAAVSFTSSLVTFVSRFAVQARPCLLTALWPFPLSLLWRVHTPPLECLDTC
jgi:hypothetical protein